MSGNVELISGGREALVTLGPLELVLGATVGIHRSIKVIQDDLQNRANGLDNDGNVWTRHIEGANAEIAVAKALDKFWGGAGAGSLTAPKATGGDVGRLQVRCRIAAPFDQQRRLIIQARDADHEDFVFVVGRAPAYRVVGWINAGAAKTHDSWIANPGNYGEAWFVPQPALHDLRTLEP